MTGADSNSVTAGMRNVLGPEEAFAVLTKLRIGKTLRGIS